MKKIIVVNVVLLISSLFLSCSEDFYYFDKPQPIDSKNIYKTPKKLRGTWVEDHDSSKIAIATLNVGKRFYNLTQELSEKELKSKLEADSTIIFANNKIYKVEGDSLRGGYDYRVYGDSIEIYLRIIERKDIGQNTFFKKFDYGYILNIRHSSLDDWWSINYINTTNQNKLIIQNLSSSDFKLVDNYEVLDTEFSQYILANWRKDDFKKFIDDGGFSDTLYQFNKIR